MTATTTTAAASASLSRFASRTARLADRLDHVGLPHDATFARILAARALIRTGRADDRISSLLDQVRPRGVAVPLELRLAAHLARAELAASHGDRATAFAELRSGLTRLHEQRRTLGSLDLQAGTATLGSELTSTGLRLALSSGSPRSIFTWSERSRAQAFRVRPVRPPDDPQTAADLAEFRKLDENLRNAELGGRTDASARQRHAALRRQLRNQSWKTTAGSRPAPAPVPAPTPGPSLDVPSGSPPTLAEITAELAACGHAMINLLRQDDQLLALAIADGTTTLVALGGYAHTLEAAYRLLSDLDARGGRRLPERLQAVIDQSIRRQFDVLTAEITAPLRPYLRDLPVIVVPTGPLAAVPWSLLPDLRRRPVTVCPSAHLWLSAHRSDRSSVRDGSNSGSEHSRNSQHTGSSEHTDHSGHAKHADHSGPMSPDSRPVLAAGPRLLHAEAEVTAIAGFYADPIVLTGRAATVEATLRAMDGARTVHLAAHGHHERGNVMFARIDLADGPLMAYDLQRLSKPPQRVILSACEVGRSEIRGGDEHLGFTAALLYAGTSTVIASGALVPDSTAAPLMSALHKSLAAGVPPAAALAGALANAMAANHADPFVCFGAG